MSDPDCDILIPERRAYEIAGIHRDTWVRLIDAGDGPPIHHIHPVTGRRTYKLSTVREWLAQRTAEAEALRAKLNQGATSEPDCAPHKEDDVTHKEEIRRIVAEAEALAVEYEQTADPCSPGPYFATAIRRLAAYVVKLEAELAALRGRTT